MNRIAHSTGLSILAAVLAFAASARAQSLIVATNTLETGSQTYTFGEITNGATYTLSGAGAVLNMAGNFYLGTDTVSGVRNGNLIITNGAVFNQTSGSFVLDADAGRKSSLLISGAAFTNLFFGIAWPANDSGAASIIINGGSTALLPNMDLCSSNGYFEISGGSKVQTGKIRWSPNAANEYFNMVVKDAGTRFFVTNTGGLTVGNRGSGRLEVSGGALITNAGPLYVGVINSPSYPVGSETGWLYMASGGVMSNTTSIKFGGPGAGNGYGVGIGLLTDPGTILTFVGGNAGITVSGTNNAYRSMVVVSNGAFMGAMNTAFIDANGAGTILAVDGGIIHTDYGLITSLNPAGLALAGVSNIGGVFQFGGANPTITTNGGAIVVQNGTISFRGINNASVTANISGNGLTNLTYLGTNSFQLNNASNTSVAFYNFSASYGATNWAALRLTGATSGWRSTTVHFDTNASLLVTNTIASILGAVTNDGTIRIANSAATFQGNVVLNGGSFFTANAGTNAFNAGLTIKSGATFALDAFSTLSGAVTNQGLVDVLAGEVVNYGSGGVAPAGNGVFRVGSGATLNFTTGSFTVANTVSNLGAINVSNAVVTYSAPVVIGGRYYSDPSTNIFTSNVTVTASGYLVGSNGDLFVFQKDFINQSTNASQFNLSHAAVLFTNSATHVMSLSNSGSAFIGQGFTSFAQVSTNFGIGQLSIAAGNRLTIAGNKDSLTNALYLGWLDIQGILTNSYANVTNGLFAALNLPNINVYYDKYDARNGWLNANLINDSAAGFNLWGGGLLLPIPEPSALATLAAGVGLLAFLCRRK